MPSNGIPRFGKIVTVGTGVVTLKSLLDAANISLVGSEDITLQNVSSTQTIYRGIGIEGDSAPTTADMGQVPPGAAWPNPINAMFAARIYVAASAAAASLYVEGWG